MGDAKCLGASRLGQALVYKKIRQAVGIKKTVVSGGGSLAPHLDDFFEILGLQVVNGWGLSEVVTPSSPPQFSAPAFANAAASCLAECYECLECHWSRCSVCTLSRVRITHALSDYGRTLSSDGRALENVVANAFLLATEFPSNGRHLPCWPAVAPLLLAKTCGGRSDTPFREP